MESTLSLLDQLDTLWASDQPAPLEDLLNQLPAEANELRVELCAADMEWRYRKHAAQTIAENQWGTLPKTPRAKDYQALLGKVWDEHESQQNLLEAEWCARTLWGDSPDVDAFALQFPFRTRWSDRLSKQVNDLVPLKICVSGKSLPNPLYLRVSHNFVIGRQATGEPEAPAWCRASHRLILANAHYRVLSRKQIRVRRTRLNEVELNNNSQVRTVRCEKHQLAPNTSLRMNLPFSIQIATQQIQFFLSE